MIILWRNNGSVYSYQLIQMENIPFIVAYIITKTKRDEMNNIRFKLLRFIFLVLVSGQRIYLFIDCFFTD